MKRLLPIATMACLAFAAAVQAATPGITSTAGTIGTFALTAAPAFINQPDGNQVYSWGYGCTPTSAGAAPAATFVPAAMVTAGAVPSCSNMQIPGPTLVVTEGTTVSLGNR